MSQTTYRKISEYIRNSHYGGTIPDSDAAISIRFVAEKVAMKIAFMAKKNAFENSNAGETTFANDQFISVFYGVPVQKDSVTSEFYIQLPATPAGLPNNQEIDQVSFINNPSLHILPMRNKDSFQQDGLQKFWPKGQFCFYKIQDGKAVFYNLPKLVTTNNSCLVKMIGAVPGNTLLDSVLNVPKDVEDEVVNSVLQELTVEYQVKPKTVLIGEPT